MWTSPNSQHKNRLITLFAVKDGEALYSQQKQDRELTVVQIMSSLLPNSDLKKKKKSRETTRQFRYDLNQIPCNYTMGVTKKFQEIRSDRQSA